MLWCSLPVSFSISKNIFHLPPSEHLPILLNFISLFCHKLQETTPPETALISQRWHSCSLFLLSLKPGSAAHHQKTNMYWVLLPLQTHQTEYHPMVWSLQPCRSLQCRGKNSFLYIFLTKSCLHIPWHYFIRCEYLIKTKIWLSPC